MIHESDSQQMRQDVLDLEFLLPPSAWVQITGISVYDPDAWREDGKDWTAPITRDEFINRCADSTCWYPPGFFKEVKLRVVAEAKFALWHTQNEHDEVACLSECPETEL